MQQNNKTSNWIACGALGVSIISIAISTYLYFHQKQIEFSNQGIQNRPRLEVLGPPEISSIEMKTKELVPVSSLFKEEPPLIPMTLSLDTKITVKNEGNSIAKLIFYAVMDKPTGAPDVRKEIFNILKGEKGNIEPIDEYKTTDILPGQKHTFNIPRTIESIDENRMFTLHFFFLYSNELGNKFDSYYWVRYLVNDEAKIMFKGNRNEFKAERKGNKWVIPTEKAKKILQLYEPTPEEAKKFFPQQVKKPKFSTKMYSYKESKALSNYIEETKKRVLEKQDKK